MATETDSPDSTSGAVGLPYCSICLEQAEQGYSHLSGKDLAEHTHIVCCDQCVRSFFVSFNRGPVCRTDLQEKQVTIINKAEDGKSVISQTDQVFKNCFNISSP